MDYLYRAYGIRIASNIELPELLPDTGPADLMICVDHEGHAVRQIRQQPSVLSGTLEGIGTFYIHQGNAITVEPHTQDMSVLRPTLLGGAIAIALRQRGLLVLHASCVNLAGQAIAFMGDSGWGKSTLAAAFHHQGDAILTDDVMAIQFEGAGPLVEPGFPQIKLWPDAADSFGHSPGQLPPIGLHMPKLSYCFDQGFQQESLPLKQIYVLRKGAPDGPLCEIQPLSHQAAFLELIRHTREMRGMDDIAIQKAHFHQCTALLKSVSVSYLIRRPQLTDLADLITYIKGDVLEDALKVPSLVSPSRL